MSAHPPSWVPRRSYQPATPVPGSGTVASSTWVAAQYPDLDNDVKSLPHAVTRLC